MGSREVKEDNYELKTILSQMVFTAFQSQIVTFIVNAHINTIDQFNKR